MTSTREIAGWKKLAEEITVDEPLSSDTRRLAEIIRALITEIERLSAPLPTVQEIHRNFGEHDAPPRGRFQDTPAPTEADVEKMVEQLLDNGYAPAGNAMPLRVRAADMLMRLPHSSAAGPSEDEVKAAQMITQRYRKQINDTPELLSLLYDIDLLPEQIRRYVNAVRMAAFCQLYAHTSPSAAGAEWQPINSAPSSGQPILVYGGRHSTPTLVAADGKWWRQSAETYNGSNAVPTHWMPLPAPPVAAGEEG